MINSNSRIKDIISNFTICFDFSQDIYHDYIKTEYFINFEIHFKFLERKQPFIKSCQQC